jgi:hypothetical protein
MASKRIVFTFDDRSAKALEQMTKNAQYSSMAETVRDSLQIANTIQDLSRRGFTELVVRNPKSGAERNIVIPNLVVPQELPTG